MEEQKIMRRNNNLGNIYYDVTDARFKRLRKKKTGEWDWQTLDVKKYDKEADKKINELNFQNLLKKQIKQLRKEEKLKKQRKNKRDWIS
jgi:hypothetical protein